jgi:hypothetical protein
MSNTKYTAKERQEYMRRLAAIEVLIPENYSETINTNTGISRHIIRNARQCRTINWRVLKALESLCQPKKAKI